MLQLRQEKDDLPFFLEGILGEGCYVSQFLVTAISLVVVLVFSSLYIDKEKLHSTKLVLSNISPVVISL